MACGGWLVALLGSDGRAAYQRTAPAFNWIKPSLTFLAAALSLWSPVARNERRATECADLHFRWNTLAHGYEDLWANMYAENAPAILADLRKEDAGISKSSTTLPSYKDLLEKMQATVVMHHEHHLAA